MKKWVSLAVIVVLVLAIAPWGIGMVAEKRVDRGLDAFVKAAPYITIVEKKYTRGWFRSEQDVTFDVFGAWAKALSKPMASAAQTESGGMVLTSAPADTAPAATTETGETPVPDAAAAPEETFKGLRFVVHNEILHGPVLGLSGLGIARVNSRIEWPPEVQKELTKTFGEDQILKIATRVGFLGGGTTTLSADKRIVKSGGSEISWDDFAMSVGYSKNADHMDFEGKWPRFEVTEANGSRLVMSDMKMDGSAERILGELYDTDGDFSMKSMNIVGADKDNVEIKDLLYRVDTDKHGDFLDMGFKLGTGSIISRQVTLKEAHYDFSARRLHIETLNKFLAAMKNVYAMSIDTPSDLEVAVVKPYKEFGVALLKYDPEFAIDRIMIATAEGEGVIKGVIKVKGVTEADFAGMDAMALIPKIDAVFDIDVSEDMLAKLSGNATAAGAAIDAGYATRKDGHLISHIEFKAGALTINGKLQALPGMGGPPPPPPQ
jgi:uncharacterized protein YdgA (DUF945 family)